MKTILYFAYGSNLNLDQMFRRCPTAEPVSRGVLRDYELRYRSSVATVEKKKGSSVHGALYELDAACWEVLDTYEGNPSLYRKEIVEVESKDGIQLAVTYKMFKYYTLDQPTKHYYDSIEQGYQDWGLDPRHLEKSLKGKGFARTRTRKSRWAK